MTSRGDEHERPGEVVRPAMSGDARDGSLPVSFSGSTVSIRKSFGLPVGVSLVADLPRGPTDREWELLISEFRSAFGVQGVATTSGGLRDWSHGKLHISVEPTEQGARLRLGTMKEDAAALNGFGFFMLALAVLMGAVVAISGKTEKALPVMSMFGGMALLSFFGAHLVRTPMWARERQQQMERIAAHAVEMLSKP